MDHALWVGPKQGLRALSAGGKAERYRDAAHELVMIKVFDGGRGS